MATQSWGSFGVGNVTERGHASVESLLQILGLAVGGATGVGLGGGGGAMQS